MRSLVTVMIVLAVASVAQAGALVPKHVAADAQWFGHINFEKIRSLPMLPDGMAPWQGDSRCQERIEEMSEKLGMDLMEDLLGVTLYSTQYEGEVGVCLFYVKRVNQEKMVAFFKDKCPHHEAITHGDRTLYRWTVKHHSKEMTLTGTFGSETLIVIGADTKHVKAALDVLDGKKAGLDKEAPLLRKVSKRALFVSRAIDVPEDYRKTTKCPVLRDCSAAFAQWVENKGQITGAYRFSTDSEETAENYKAIVDGFAAMARLRYGDSRAVMKVVEGLEGTTKDNRFRVVWKTTTDDVQAALEQIMKHKDEGRRAKKDELKDIVDTAVSAGSFRTLDFTGPDALEAWQTVNDGVMGGVSEGNVRMTKDQTLEFFGNLSLENNGGFASTRTRRGKLDLSQYEALVVKVRGDGRTYYFNIHVPTRQFAFSYRAKFATEKDKWREIRIPLKDFQATSFGRVVPGAAPLDAKNIQSIGFLLSDKKAGPFNLEVAWIKGLSKSGK